MRYISIYLNETPIVCIDLHKPIRADIIDAIYYAEKFKLDGFISNYKNIFKAKFDRTADSNDNVTSRQIKLHDIPKRLNNSELIAMLEGLQQRGKDKGKRKMNPKSLANLKPAKAFTHAYHPTKPRKLTDQQVEKAKELRSNGCSWRKVGDLLECNFQTVRSSLRRMEEKAANSAGNLRLLTGAKTASRRYPTVWGCSAR